MSGLQVLSVAVLLAVLAGGEAASPDGSASEGLLTLKKFVGYSLLRSKALRGGRLGDVWSDCSKPGDHLKIVSVDVMPDPPKKGENLTVKANITLSEEVTAGTVKVNIDIDGVNVLTEDFDLCGILPQVNLMCPLSKGAHLVNITIFLPDDIPSGHLTGTQYAMDSSGAELVCVKLDLKL